MKIQIINYKKFKQKSKNQSKNKRKLDRIRFLKIIYKNKMNYNKLICINRNIAKNT